VTRIETLMKLYTKKELAIMLLIEELKEEEE